MLSEQYKNKRIVIMCEGNFGVVQSKIASAFIKYNEPQCVAVINSEYAGKDVSEILGWGEGIPIVGTFEEARAFHPDTMLIGVTIQGKKFPAEWRPIIKDAISAELDIIAGLVYKLNEDEEFAELAKKFNVTLTDTKTVPSNVPVGRGIADEVEAFVVHTVGSDCRVGKKSTAIEIALEAKRRNIAANFGATGQTGIMLTGSGLCIDSVVVDFLGGAMEQVVLETAKGADWAIIEGQGALTHPGFGGVTCQVIQSAVPDAMILCHHVNREFIYGTQTPIPSLQEVIERVEYITKYTKPAKVVGISLNTHPMNAEEAALEVAKVERELGLPTTDPYKFGVGKLVDALQAYQCELPRFKNK
ncbi:DUF1611 domain-containing protein [Aestuariibacter sp. AA17]|uniref:DUF1611 domain-containing protein n=1 Tax=Fluctibacter corallii TaxID=2984329 RepID=A0ABT3A6X9_9ALTE|nr:DUF1611 domain-containing protein [Aestuariibacter sp. AA17]MCV2884444.1 DUF1611 domain-containing protein [Aestuariibacter sp. AA17]